MPDDMISNPRARIGGNNPPESIDAPTKPTPFDVVSKRILDLYDEATLWLDGAKVDSQDLADGIANLTAELRKAAEAADEARIAENKPFDDGKAAVQAKYAPLIADTKKQKGKAILAIEGCKAALAPWLLKIDQEKRAAAEKARKEAEEKTRAAQEAIRAAQRDNLAERAAAEELIINAKKAQRAAVKAEKSTATAGNGFGRSLHLRTVYTPVMTDMRAAARHYWTTRENEMEAFFQGLADADVRAGIREIPGFEIREEKVTV